MTNLIILAVVAVILLVVIRYLVKAKRRGVKCVGCPHAKSCGSNTGHTCGCGVCGE